MFCLVSCYLGNGGEYVCTVNCRSFNAVAIVDLLVTSLLHNEAEKGEGGKGEGKGEGVTESYYLGSSLNCWCSGINVS